MSAGCEEMFCIKGTEGMLQASRVSRSLHGSLNHGNTRLINVSVSAFSCHASSLYAPPLTAFPSLFPRASTAIRFRFPFSRRHGTPAPHHHQSPSSCLLLLLLVPSSLSLCPDSREFRPKSHSTASMGSNELKGFPAVSPENGSFVTLLFAA